MLFKHLLHSAVTKRWPFLISELQWDIQDIHTQLADRTQSLKEPRDILGQGTLGHLKGHQTCLNSWIDWNIHTPGSQTPLASLGFLHISELLHCNLWEQGTWSCLHPLWYSSITSVGHLSNVFNLQCCLALLSSNISSFSHLLFFPKASQQLTQSYLQNDPKITYNFFCAYLSGGKIQLPSREGFWGCLKMLG